MHVTVAFINARCLDVSQCIRVAIPVINAIAAMFFLGAGWCMRVTVAFVNATEAQETDYQCLYRRYVINLWLPPPTGLLLCFYLAHVDDSRHAKQLSLCVSAKQDSQSSTEADDKIWVEQLEK